MKTTLLLAAGAALLTFVSFGAAQGQEMSCCQSQEIARQTAGTKPQAATQTKAAQKASITINGGYSPAALSVTVGKPVELTFVRKSTGGCDGEIVFPTLNIKRTLKPGEKTVVKFTPKKSGTLAYTCGMGMYRGSIVVK